ncbi:septum formation family protein [Leifsonia sp. NPDC056824]|uniref:septum formation family protein n=1 Tax=Leifsonia sp. NPDC056824 TaxID=3345953 RepID=UPI0036B08268
MRDRRSPGDPDGLSRRGWIVLVAATAGAAVVLLSVAAFANGLPAGHARADLTAATPSGPPHPLDPAPTPLGLPPRPTHTPPVATVPEQPVGSIATGSCLQVFPSPWANTYPVIDCASPHIAQVISQGALPQAAGAPFPGVQALNTQVGDLCTAPGILDWNWVAVWNEDVQVELRYPNSATQWETGDRAYKCFVDTFSRHELTGTAVAAH